MTTLTENYRETLEALKKQLLSSRFLRWWLGELSSMGPAWLRPPRLAADSFVSVGLNQVNAQWSGMPKGESRQRALTLPGDCVLRKTLTLPLATEENLRQVLEFQMEQHTPFSPRQVYFGYSVKDRNFERGQLNVEFVVTPRDAVDAAIKTLNVLGLEVHAVFAQDMWNKGTLVNLLPDTLTSAPSPFRQGANPWLVLLIGLLVFAAMVMPIVIKREAVVQMLPWVEKGKKAAEAVDAVRRELDGRIAQHNYLLEKRQARPTVIQTLEELTRVLPDDTWVQTIEIKGKELQIQGETASSARLIGLFEQSSLLGEASFRAPLTKGQASGSERYQLALQIKPMPLAQAVRASPQNTVSAPLPATYPQSAASSPLQKASVARPTASEGVQKP